MKEWAVGTGPIFTRAQWEFTGSVMEQVTTSPSFSFSFCKMGEKYSCLSGFLMFVDMLVVCYSYSYIHIINSNSN